MLPCHTCQKSFNFINAFACYKECELAPFSLAHPVRLNYMGSACRPSVSPSVTSRGTMLRQMNLGSCSFDDQVAQKL